MILSINLGYSDILRV